MARQLILDRYRPMTRAGTGGFATVQVAWDTRIRRKVAIKCLELPEVRPPFAEIEPYDISSSSEARAGRVAPPAAWTDDDAWYEDPDDGWESAPAPDPPDDGFGDPSVIDAHARVRTVREEDAGREPSLLPEAVIPGTIHPETEWLASVPGLEEARTAALLSDPNIVTVYDFEIQDSTAYLIMEYVDGLTLEEVLRDHDEKITLDIVAAVLSDVAHALDVAHTNGVLHLDIKPANILIDRQGRAKVTDFGLATLADVGGIGTTGGGTIGYMPLEQMRQEPLDARSDEWALASVVYEMLAGENPFITPTLHRAEAAAEGAELVLPSLCWDDLDEEADDIVFYALDPDPNERYESVAEFAEELLPYLGEAKRGRGELAALVSGMPEELDEKTEAGSTPERKLARKKRSRRSLAEILTPRKRAFASRGLAAVGAAVAAASAAAGVPALSSVGSVGMAAPLAAAVAAAAIAAIFPSVGALVAFASLGAACLATGAIVYGVALIALAIAWWAFVGHSSRTAAEVALAFPLLGALGIPVSSSGVSGFAPAGAFAAAAFLRARDAVASCVLACAGTLALAALAGGDACGFDAIGLWVFGGPDSTGVAANAVADPSRAVVYDSPVQDRIVALLGEPTTWGVLVGWCAAAALGSLCFGRGTRAFAYVGALAGVIVIIVAALCAVGFASDTLEPFELIAPIVSAACGAGVTCALIKSLGPPERA